MKSELGNYCIALIDYFYFLSNGFSLLEIYLQWLSNNPVIFVHLVSHPCLNVFNNNYKNNNYPLLWGRCNYSQVITHLLLQLNEAGGIVTPNYILENQGKEKVTYWRSHWDLSPNNFSQYSFFVCVYVFIFFKLTYFLITLTYNIISATLSIVHNSPLLENESQTP